MRPRRPVKLVPWFDDDQDNVPNDNGCLWSTVGERLATIVEENEEGTAVGDGEDEEEDLPSVEEEEEDPWEDTDSEDSVDTVVDNRVQCRIDEIREKVKDGFDDDEEENYDEAIYMETTDPEGSTLKLEVFLLKRGVAMFETVECDDDSDTTSTDSSSDPSTPTNKRETKVGLEKPLEGQASYKRIECIIKDGVKIPRPKDILFIFDYDDTILPSTWCAHNAAHPGGVSARYGSIVDELNRISRIAQKTFDMCYSLNGDICIITNAEEGWVEYSSSALLPSIAPTLESFGITSARSKYAKTFYDGGDGIRWKLRAFYDKVTKWLETRSEWEKLSGEKLDRPSVYSFGDSYAEREALRQTCRDYDIMGRVDGKSFKFIEKPRPDQIRKQHRLLQGSLRRMVDGVDNGAPEPSGGLASTLQTLFEQMSDGSKGPADIRSFFDQCKKVCPELMREPYRQHDSQVLLEAVLDGLPENSRKMFEFKLMDSILCDNCSYVNRVNTTDHMLRLKIGAHPHPGEPILVELHRDSVDEKWGVQWDEESYWQRRELVIRSVSPNSRASLQLAGNVGWKCVRVNDSTSRIDMRQEMCQRRHVEMALLPPEDMEESTSDLDWLIKATYNPKLNREVISDYHCDECKADTSCTRSTEIVSEMPPCLVVHIWRDMYLTGMKDTTYVSFDRYLKTFETADGKQRYRLTGVVEHLGYSLNSGHYVAYVARDDGPDGGQEQWYFCSDSVVEPISYEEVATKNAYMLFYVLEDCGMIAWLFCDDRFGDRLEGVLKQKAAQLTLSELDRQLALHSEDLAPVIREAQKRDAKLPWCRAVLTYHRFGRSHRFDGPQWRTCMLASTLRAAVARLGKGMLINNNTDNVVVVDKAGEVMCCLYVNKEFKGDSSVRAAIVACCIMLPLLVSDSTSGDTPLPEADTIHPPFGSPLEPFALPTTDSLGVIEAVRKPKANNAVAANCYSKNKGYFEDEAFLNYLRYLEYLRQAPFFHLLVYPSSMDMIRILRCPSVREQLVKEPTAARAVLQEQLWCSWGMRAEEELKDGKDVEDDEVDEEMLKSEILDTVGFPLMPRRPVGEEGKSLVRNALDQAHSHNVFLEKQAMWAEKRKLDESERRPPSGGRLQRESSSVSSRHHHDDGPRKRLRKHETDAVKEHRSNEEEFWEAERARHAREKARYADRMIRREKQMQALRDVVAMPNSLRQGDFLWSDGEVSDKEEKQLEKKKKKKHKHHKK
ncbi:ubiquitin-specific protease ubp2 [Perkinsus chesapeaki]|uniref:Ubiquitin-specific protease ubp2 n=1 Tax=Perkinsus chesapeaki TaxID=330153 RepID=A0A7J6MYT2_PERCH|nr:ubiquitin-specific protease ubp2 [Perkinsus chesapeaki]